MKRKFWLALLLLLAPVAPARAGVVNPDISVIGQPFMRWADDFNDPARKRPTVNVGEVEAMFDAALNPYARGTFILSIANGGIDVEEGYFQLLRGLPAGLALKGGKYRVGFGKLNPQHPHTWPFADRFNVLADYLPGAESFDEVGLSLSERIPMPGDISLTATADWLQGDTFRIARTPSGAANDPISATTQGDRADEPRPAGVGRLAAFVPIGDRSGLELGLSGTQGTNNVAAATRTTVYGADAKLKYWNGDRSYLILQTEILHLDRDDAGWDEPTASYTKTTVKPSGGYVYADYNFALRYNAGAGYERWQEPTVDKTWDQAFKAYAGLALMEETTAFRVDWDHKIPGQPTGAPVKPDAVNTITVRVIFSMGPHKAHQF